jgi:cell division protein ZapA (FtsZ GTPase activity inhibitor)
VSKAKPLPIDVEIFDQKYSIVLQTCISEHDVRSLAAEVDSRMREIAAVASTADSLKIAVLTALHFAQELRDINLKTNEWSHTLEEVLSKR